MNKLVSITALFVAAITVANPAWAEGDPVAGEVIFKRCTACHTADQGGANKVGPNLAGIVGRKPGIIPGFAYSPSYPELASKGVVWEQASLFAYLAEPQKFVKEMTGDANAKSKMTFILKSEKEREDVIAYLKTR